MATGYSMEVVLGKPLVESFISKDSRKAMSQVSGDALNGDGSAYFKFPLFAADCSKRDVSLDVTARRSSDGRIVSVWGDETGHHEVPCHQVGAASQGG